MANEAKWNVDSYTGVSVLTCAHINTLASAAMSCNSSLISNSSSSAHMYGSFELLTWITTGTCAPTCLLYAVPSLDLTNPASTQDQQASLLGTFPMSTATSTAAGTQKRIPLVNVLLPASDFQVCLLNLSGSAFSTAIASNQVRYWAQDVYLNG